MLFVFHKHLLRLGHLNIIKISIINIISTNNKVLLLEADCLLLLTVTSLNPWVLFLKRPLHISES